MSIALRINALNLHRLLPISRDTNRNPLAYSDNEECVRGYFYVEMDPKADTSIVYSISFDFSQISDSFIVENIEETTSGNLIRTDESTYSKVITLNEIKENKKNNVRVYLKWENKEDNNATDSKIGLTENNYINIPVSVSAMQYFGEDIEEYQENGQ